MTSKSKAGFDVAASLNAPHFQEQSGQGLPVPDPSIPTRIRVNLDNVVPCSHNPRKTRNPKFDDIKESIRNRGLDEPPQVTRKDPSHPYMIKRGGNSRLEILNELWSETQDAKFYEFDCMFVPWPKDGELDLLVGSIVENEERGDMLFIERAIAAVDTKLMLEARDGKVLGSSALSRELKLMGWSIDQSNLGQLIYAHETLFPIIPNTFWNGLGHASVKKIRKILSNAQTFWESVAKPEEGIFDEIWQTAFAALDGDAFEIGEAQNQLEADIALRLNVPFTSVRGEIQAIAQGLPPEGVRPTNLITDTQESPQGTQSTPSNSQGAAKSKSPTNTQPSTTHGAAQPQQVTRNNDLNTGESNGSIQQHNQTAALPLTDNIHDRLASLSLDDLKHHCFLLAQELAVALGFEPLIATAEGVGFNGFNGFHSGYVLFAEDPANQLSSEATFYYLYLHQLSNWFVEDHSNPDYWQVSNQIPISFLGEPLYWSTTQTMLHRRATLYTAWKQGDAIGRYMPLIEELEVAVAIISFQSGLGA